MQFTIYNSCIVVFRELGAGGDGGRRESSPSLHGAKSGGEKNHVEVVQQQLQFGISLSGFYIVPRYIHTYR